MALLLAFGMTVAGALVGATAMAAFGRRRTEGRSAEPATAAVVEAAEERAAVAVIGVARSSDVRARLGFEGATRLMDCIADRAAAELPVARVGRIGRSSVEIDFSVAPERADALIERLAAAIGTCMGLDTEITALGLAIGYAIDGGDAIARPLLVERAEQALGRAHASHQTIARFDAEDERHANRRDGILRDLRSALSRDEMHLCYQPKLRSRANAIDAAEALLRWRHPEHGLIPPDEFIPLAEASGEIGKITRWVLTRAIADQATLAAAGHEVILHVNLSGRLVADRTFADWALEACANAVGRIGFEVTETAVIDDPEAALANLNAFAAAGIKIAIDDYGTGLSSLAYLKAMPADELKIDKLFISALTTTNRDPLLVRSTIDLAHALEMEVTAEGVDTATALALLRVMGCDLVQGYHVSVPVPLDALRAFLDAHIADEGRQTAPAPLFPTRRLAGAA